MARILGAPLCAKLIRAELSATVEFFDQRALQCADRRFGIAVGAPERLLDDPVDDTERL